MLSELQRHGYGRQHTQLLCSRPRHGFTVSVLTVVGLWEIFTQWQSSGSGAVTPRRALACTGIRHFAPPSAGALCRGAANLSAKR